MATITFTISELTDAQLDRVERLIQSHLRKELDNDSIEVDEQDREEDEEDEEE